MINKRYSRWYNQALYPQTESIDTTMQSEMSTQMEVDSNIESQNIYEGHEKTISFLINKIYSYKVKLKFAHWNATGQGSYAKHMAIDEAHDHIAKLLDKLVETTIGNGETIEFCMPETHEAPSIIEASEWMYYKIDYCRELFTESYSQAILDEIQECIKHLNYKLTRLQ